ncbi:MAG: hypothetical protein CSA31_00585 [Desulfobulbus propionicus]|nr:MAG: hypothetical protein CSA31_00585 [Desulfobulbus propionicus]
MARLTKHIQFACQVNIQLMHLKKPYNVNNLFFVLLLFLNVFLYIQSDPIRIILLHNTVAILSSTTSPQKPSRGLVYMLSPLQGCMTSNDK